jgi:hypothetical protein
VNLSEGASLRISEPKLGIATNEAVAISLRTVRTRTLCGPTGGGACGNTDPNTRTCSTSQEDIEAQLDAATCGAGCTLTVSPGGAEGAFELTVTGELEGSTRLDATVRLSDGEKLHASVPLRFSKSRSIALLRSVDSPQGDRYAMLEGSEQHWCSQIRDALGQPILHDPSHVTLALSGAQETYALGDCRSFKALGAASIGLSYAFQDLTLQKSLNVFAPSDVATAAIVALANVPTPDRYEVGRSPVPVERDALELGVVPSALEIPCVYPGIDVAVRVTLKNGALGLGPASALAVAPGSVARLETSSFFRGTLRGRALGSGLLTFALGDGYAEVPIYTPQACEHQDTPSAPNKDAGVARSDSGK